MKPRRIVAVYFAAGALVVVLMPIDLIARLWLGVGLSIDPTVVVAVAYLAVGVLLLASPPRAPMGSIEPQRRSTAQSAVVVIVAFNEESAIASVVAGFRALACVRDVIVVDNASTDATSAEAINAGATVVLEQNRGYGAACIRGLEEGLRSGADIVALTEGDATFSATDLVKLMAYLPHADLVVGSRTNRVLVSDASQMDKWYTWGNLLVAKLLQFRYWDWKTFGAVRFTDVGCTYRAMRAEGLAKILPLLKQRGDTFSPHMLMAALDNGLSVVEVPVTFWPRVGKSKGAGGNHWKGLVVGLRMAWMIMVESPRSAR